MTLSKKKKSNGGKPVLFCSQSTCLGSTGLIKPRLSLSSRHQHTPGIYESGYFPEQTNVLLGGCWEQHKSRWLKAQEGCRKGWARQVAFAEGTQGQQAVAAGTAASTAGQAEEPGWLDPDPWEVGREGRGKSHLCFFGFMEALEKPAPVGDWVVPVFTKAPGSLCPFRSPSFLLSFQRDPGQQGSIQTAEQVTNLRSSCRWTSFLTTHRCPLTGCGFCHFCLLHIRILRTWRPYVPQTFAPCSGRWVGGGFPGLAFIPTRVKQGIRSVRCCRGWSFRLWGLLRASGHHLPLNKKINSKVKKEKKERKAIDFSSPQIWKPMALCVPDLAQVSVHPTLCSTKGRNADSAPQSWWHRPGPPLLSRACLSWDGCLGRQTAEAKNEGCI